MHFPLAAVPLRWTRLRTALVVPVALSLGCVLPTERSSELRAEITAFGDLIVGETHEFTGRVVDASGNVVPNATLAFESDNPSVAAVASDGAVTALAVGAATVTARALGFPGAAEDTRVLFVHDRIAIDSVRPATVKYGETVELFGVGLDPERLLLVALGGATAPVLRYVPDDPQAPSRFGTLTVWAAPPAPLHSQAAVIGIDGTRTSPETTLVVQRDLYEPNDTVPSDLGALGASDVIFNPALAFEPIGRDDSARTDWYRFRHTESLDRTLVIKPGTAGPASYAAFLTNSLRSLPGGGFTLGSRSWTIGPGLYACGGFPFEPQQRVADSTVVALRGLPAGGYDVLAVYVREGSYGLALLPGYYSRLPPDPAEENDYCDVAAALAVDGPPIALTIDNAFEVDWFRITMATSEILNISVDAVAPDALLDLYLFRDGLPDSLPERGRDLAAGPSSGLTTFITTGAYLLAVVDFAGQATNYTLTVTLGPQLTTRSTLPRRAAPRGVPRALPRLPLGGNR